MIDGRVYRFKELDNNQDASYIERAILDILKEKRVSLSQIRVIFNNLLKKIEDENIITL